MLDFVRQGKGSHSRGREGLHRPMSACSNYPGIKRKASRTDQDAPDWNLFSLRWSGSRQTTRPGVPGRKRPHVRQLNVRSQNSEVFWRSPNYAMVHRNYASLLRSSKLFSSATLK